MQTARSKSDDLVAAAARIAHRHGVMGTTLANVAAEAKVPLGNVYYYFKTKNDLVRAVVQARLAEIEAFVAMASKEPTPAERLGAFIEGHIEGAEMIVALGCPYGTLASELERSPSPDDPRGTVLLAREQRFLETQLRAAGLPAARARNRANELLCEIQGACLVAHALHDAVLFKTRLKTLARTLRAELTARSTKGSPS